MSKLKDRWKVRIIAILVIGFLEAIALMKNIDGSLLALSFAAIGGIAGYKIKR